MTTQLTLSQILSAENLQATLQFYRKDMTHWSRAVSNSAFKAKPLFYIVKLLEEVNAGRYQVEPIRRVNIPKSSGGVRRIAELSLKDKFLQRAFMQLFSPKIDGVFNTNSFAFRSGRNCDMAYNLVKHRIAEGHHFVLHADIKSCFDHINLKRLQQQIFEFVVDKQVKALIHQWLFAHATSPSWLTGKSTGVPQGSVLAPTFANLYLHPIDEYLAAKHIRFCRYADDLLLQFSTHKAAEQGHLLLSKQVNRIGLSLNQEKLFLGRSSPKIKFLGKPLPAA